MAEARWLKRAGVERTLKERHLSMYHCPCQWIPKRCQSSLRTGSWWKAFLRLSLPMSARGPSVFTITKAESIVPGNITLG